MSPLLFCVYRFQHVPTTVRPAASTEDPEELFRECRVSPPTPGVENRGPDIPVYQGSSMGQKVPEDASDTSGSIPNSSKFQEILKMKPIVLW